MTTIRFEGSCGTLEATPEQWDELLTIAEDHGWQPEYQPILYRADVGLDVSPADAYGIASALRDAAEHFILHETTTKIPDLPHLVGDIYEVIAFCWVGQGTYDASDWDEAMEEANSLVGDGVDGAVSELLEMPMLASVLEQGLAAFELSCDGIGDLS